VQRPIPVQVDILDVYVAGGVPRLISSTGS
jgi:hypothetical protein